MLSFKVFPPALASLLSIAALCIALLCISSTADASLEPQQRINRIQNGLLPVVIVKGEPIHTTALIDRMATLRVPGVSIAVIKDGKIEWARGFGVTKVGGLPVTTETLFQAASISKAVTALAVLHLVESGKLDLDADVNRYLKTWNVPQSPLTEKNAVTLRGLLTHTAGITVHGFRGYEAQTPQPTLLQILNGEPPANSGAIRVDMAPGKLWRYSGGGYVIAQQVLSDVMQEPFPKLMHDIVLQPLGMTRSTYEQVLPARLAQDAATPYRANGDPVKGGPHLYPEMAAAGLWTTPSDLARYAIEIQRSLSGKSKKVIAAKTTRAMLTRHLNNWGLGLQLGGSAKRPYFSHRGDNDGYRCLLIAYDNGDGAVIMTNSEGGADDLIVEILGTIAHEYGWPDFQPPERTIVTIDSNAMEAVVGRYDFGAGGIFAVIRKDDRLFTGPGDLRYLSELFPVSSEEFFYKTNRSTVTFVKDADGQAVKAIRSEGGFSIEGSRLTGTDLLQASQERPDWARYFSDVGVKGTIVVADERLKASWVHDPDRARKPFVPASTFKIPHTLFALDAGIVQSDAQVFPWDGTRRDVESWNRDQTLRTAMRNSVVWVYQAFARQLGEIQEREYLQRVGYGNADPSGGIDHFWLDGNLRISAFEQISFLQKLYRNELPFSSEHQQLVKDLILVETGPDWTLRAKTGWAASTHPQIGWWVGWVERPAGAVFFALNIDMLRGEIDAPKRQAITRAVLGSIGALPAPFSATEKSKQ